MTAATVLADRNGGQDDLAIAIYTPLDVVRQSALPCHLMRAALADLRAGAPILRYGWMGMTKERQRCDLPYGRVPSGTYWYSRIGLQVAWRGDATIEEHELLDAEAWLKAWIRERCGR